MNTRYRVFCITLLLLMACTRLTAQNKILSVVPIETAWNRTVVPVTVGASDTLRLILDSGMDYDGILLFDTASVPLQHFANLVEVQIGGGGSGAPSRGLSDSAASFVIGSHRFEGQRVTMLTSGTFKGFSTDGVVGYSLLGHYAVEIDYDSKRMILYEPSGFLPDTGWESIDIRFKKNRVPWTDIDIATGSESPVRLSVYIDFASAAALELLERDSNRFTMPTNTTDVYLGRGLSGDIHGKAGRISQLRLGPFTLTDVGVAVTPAAVRSRQDGADAVLGSNTLRRFNIVFDYAHHKIHLKPNRQFREPFG